MQATDDGGADAAGRTRYQHRALLHRLRRRSGQWLTFGLGGEQDISAASLAIPVQAHYIVPQLPSLLNHAFEQANH
jgi:hypothetical protein